MPCHLAGWRSGLLFGVPFFLPSRNLINSSNIRARYIAAGSVETARIVRLVPGSEPGELASEFSSVIVWEFSRYFSNSIENRLNSSARFCVKREILTPERVLLANLVNFPAGVSEAVTHCHAV